MAGGRRWEERPAAPPQRLEPIPTAGLTRRPPPAVRARARERRGIGIRLGIAYRRKPPKAPRPRPRHARRFVGPEWPRPRRAQRRTFARMGVRRDAVRAEAEAAEGDRHRPNGVVSRWRADRLGGSGAASDGDPGGATGWTRPSRPDPYGGGGSDRRAQVVARRAA